MQTVIYPNIDAERVRNNLTKEELAQKMGVATAIIRKLNPECGFVLLDKLEQMDTDTLSEFAIWLESEGLQAIATRVSSGDECSIIIEDGYVANTSPAPAKAKWEAGKF